MQIKEKVKKKKKDLSSVQYERAINSQEQENSKLF